MRKGTLQLLERIIASPSRLPDLLRNPESGREDAWAMYLPSAFNDALDIKRTERSMKGRKTTCWTQGSSFSFKEGDAIYDSPKAYEVWAEALKHVKLFVQVKHATSARRSNDSRERNSGSVTIRLFTPNQDRTQVVERTEHTLSQDDFVRFLIAGPDRELIAKMNQAEGSG